MAMYKHIIVPLDGSELSAQALPVARMMAQQTGASLTLVRSFEAMPAWQADVSHGRYSGAMAASEYDRVFAYLTGEKQRLEKLGVTTPVHLEVREGHAVEVITGLAGPHSNALIVMSTHGRSGFSRMVIGSVTSRVVGSVKNPVLVVCNREDGSPTVLNAVEHVIVPLDGSTFAPTDCHLQSHAHLARQS